MLNKPMVSVVMVTYGHEKYISQAIEGVLFQKCNFEVELIIADDCSPDKTGDIVDYIKRNRSKGAKIRYIKQKINQGMMSNFLFALQEAKGKYIALCDGDDYWNNPSKLQMQVDFLETNADYGLSCTACDRYYQELDVYIKANLEKKVRQELTFESLICSNPIKTCTTVFRNFLIQQFTSSMGSDIINLKMADAPMWLHISMNHKIKFHNESTAVYRVLENSATNVSAYRKLLFKFSRYKVSYIFLRQKFSQAVALRLTVQFLKEIPVLLLKAMLSSLNLYKPDKTKVINKRKSEKIV